jgi:hypothetical protein
MRLTHPASRIRAVRLLVTGARFAALSLSLMACSTATETSGGAACVYGEVVECPLDGGSLGSQECLPDLSAYGPCRRSTDAGTTRDASLRDDGSGGP